VAKIFILVSTLILIYFFYIFIDKTKNNISRELAFTYAKEEDMH